MTAHEMAENNSRSREEGERGRRVASTSESLSWMISRDGGSNERTRGGEGIGEPSASEMSSGIGRTFRGRPRFFGVDSAGADAVDALVLVVVSGLRSSLRTEAVVGSPFLGLPLFLGVEATFSVAGAGG